MIEANFGEGEPSRQPGEDLVLDLDGYEGPIDVLLVLAREQKVDITRISILRLADQYLAFIGEARRLRLEIAADYLVMAAWLVYLKSRLLLPEQDDTSEPSAPELAEALTFQLRRLEAMQQVGASLVARPRLGRDVFARGAPEGIELVRSPVYEASLFELLKAYADFNNRTRAQAIRIEPSSLFDIAGALERLRGVIGNVPNWQSLWSLLPEGLAQPIVRRSAIAATFAATLEMARRGEVELRQSGPFGTLFVRKSGTDERMEEQHADQPDG